MSLLICALASTTVEKSAVEIKALVSIYIPLLYVDMITYPCPNPHVGLDNIH